MNENFLIEFHVVSKNKKTILDIDCSVEVDTTLTDLLEIIFTNYDLEASGIKAMSVDIPFVREPLKLHAQDCKKTLQGLGFANGMIVRIIYVGETE